MEKDRILEALNIRYTDLKFVLEFPKECTLPRYKTSALRGGMGQMLMEQNCISDGNCEQCRFESECPVRRMMYAKYEIKPRFGGRGESNGYIIDCEDCREHYNAGEKLIFHLLLFGKTIVWFSQFFQAFYMLGQTGLGKEKARFYIFQVESEHGDFVVENNKIHLGNIGIAYVCSYARNRVKDLKKTGCKYTLEFLSPVSIKYKGEFLQEFHAEALIRSILRRVYSFDCFEGHDIKLMMWDQDLPKIISQKTEKLSIKRYSSTQDIKMDLYGITGFVTFDLLPEELLLLFAAGEKIHIGKNTSFGFGKYILR